MRPHARPTGGWWILQFPRDSNNKVVRLQFNALMEDLARVRVECDIDSTQLDPSKQRYIHVFSGGSDGGSSCAGSGAQRLEFDSKNLLAVEDGPVI